MSDPRLALTAWGRRLALSRSADGLQAVLTLARNGRLLVYATAEPSRVRIESHSSQPAIWLDRVSFDLTPKELEQVQAFWAEFSADTDQPR
jgi:hypothetical protein